MQELIAFKELMEKCQKSGCSFGWAECYEHQIEHPYEEEWLDALI